MENKFYRVEQADGNSMFLTEDEMEQAKENAYIEWIFARSEQYRRFADTPVMGAEHTQLRWSRLLPIESPEEAREDQSIVYKKVREGFARFKPVVLSRYGTQPDYRLAECVFGDIDGDGMKDIAERCLQELNGLSRDSKDVETDGIEGRRFLIGKSLAEFAYHDRTVKGSDFPLISLKTFGFMHWRPRSEQWSSSPNDEMVEDIIQRDTSIMELEKMLSPGDRDLGIVSSKRIGLTYDMPDLSVDLSIKDASKKDSVAF